VSGCVTRSGMNSLTDHTEGSGSSIGSLHSARGAIFVVERWVMKVLKRVRIGLSSRNQMNARNR
jgi:hypothetical protein